MRCQECYIIAERRKEKKNTLLKRLFVIYMLVYCYFFSFAPSNCTAASCFHFGSAFVVQFWFAAIKKGNKKSFSKMSHACVNNNMYKRINNVHIGRMTLHEPNRMKEFLSIFISRKLSLAMKITCVSPTFSPTSKRNNKHSTTREQREY